MPLVDGAFPCTERNKSHLDTVIDSAHAGTANVFVKAHYTKYEYRIPMRDGKRLFTAVYVPKQSVFLAMLGRIRS
jgi:predicted acyl esterase